MSRVYASTVCLSGKESLEKRLQMFMNEGILSIELGGGVTTTAAMLEQVPELSAKVLIHNYFPPTADDFYINLASPSEVIRQKTLDYLIDNIKRSAKWGCELYSFHAGFIADPVGFNRDGLIFDIPPATAEQIEAATQRFVAGLTILAEVAQVYHVTLAIENNVCRTEHIGRLLLQTVEEFNDLFNRIDSPYIGVLVDTGHVDVTARTLNFDRLTFIEGVRPYIKAFHVSQNNGLKDLAHPITADNPTLGQIKTIADVPVIVEAHFDTLDALSTHYHWLKSEIERWGKDGN